VARKVLAGLAGIVVLVLTLPVVCVSASGDPGPCWNVAGIQVLGNSESGDTLFLLFGLPLTALAVGLVLWLTRKWA
jgi:hypothetical protein